MKKRVEQTERTKADLREAFWLLYASRPLGKITVGEVCERAGYNRGTFYLHFHDIHELLQGIEGTLLDGMAETVEQCMLRLQRDSRKLNVLAACAEVLAYYERNKAQITVLLSEQGDPNFVRQLKDRLKPLWREYLLGADCVRSEGEIELLLEYTLSGTLFMISRWLEDPRGVTARELAHLVYDFSIKDFRTRSQA